MDYANAITPLAIETPLNTFAVQIVSYAFARTSYCYRFYYLFDASHENNIEISETKTTTKKKRKKKKNIHLNRLVSLFRTQFVLKTK